jgi:preprotein translocase subunit YajC
MDAMTGITVYMVGLSIILAVIFFLVSFIIRSQRKMKERMRQLPRPTLHRQCQNYKKNRRG